MRGGNRNIDKHAGPTGVLYRSRIEIEHVLRGLQRNNVVLSVELENGARLFVTRVLYADANADLLIVACSDDKAGNSAILAATRVVFEANQERARIEFAASSPAFVVYEGAVAARFAFPTALLRLQRRLQPRLAVPPEVPLSCVADAAGVAPFEAEISDISLGGIGTMNYGVGVLLPPGTVLRGCRIDNPRGPTIVADLEVRYTTTAALADGSYAKRSGFRFVGRPAGIEALVQIFNLEFGTEPRRRNGRSR